MRRLNKGDDAALDHHVEAINGAWLELEKSLDVFNVAISTAFGPVSVALQEYVDACDQARGFVEGS